MSRFSDYYYKGYDITSSNRHEKYLMEYHNPYGYNLECNSKRVIDYDVVVTKTNQDMIKNGILSKKNK